MLAPPGIMTPSQRLDARLRLLPDAPVALKQNAEVDFFTGAAELPARVTLLDRERLDPGESAWVQFRFRAPLAVLRNDRFIVRRPSPSETLGGGEVIDPNPPRHRRFRPETIAALETLAAGAPDEILLQMLEQRPIEIKELAAGAAGLSAAQVDDALAELIAEGDAVVLGGPGRAAGATDFAIAASLLRSLTDQISKELLSYHASQPLRPGLAREEARRRLGIAQPRLFDDLIATVSGAGELIDDGATLRLPTVPHDTRPGPAGGGRPVSGRHPGAAVHTTRSPRARARPRDARRAGTSGRGDKGCRRRLLRSRSLGCPRPGHACVHRQQRLDDPVAVPGPFRHES